jgi:pimeloyl-ACP methyl ester carboxylesterase
MMSASGYLHINGLRLYVHRAREEAAAPSGLTIVLLHGFLDAGSSWDLVVPALARAGHDIVAPDLRGFGLSENIGAGGYYHFPDYVADLAELVDGLAPRRLSIVGHSMGGTIAALYAGAHPGKVERLALLEGTGPMGTEPALAVDRMQAWLRTLREVPRQSKPLASLQEAVERLCLHHPRVPREVIESRARLLTRVDDRGRLLWAYDPLHRTTAPTPFSVDGFKEFLKRIDCPTLVVSGGPTGWHPPDEAQRNACLKQALYGELPDAGHMMHWTQPQALAQMLGSFFGDPPPVRPEAAAKSRGSTGTQIMSAHPGPAHSPHSAAPPSASPQSPVVPPAPPSWAGAAPPSVSPVRPVFGGAAADVALPPTPAGSAPVGPTRPSTGPSGSGSTGGSDGKG